MKNITRLWAKSTATLFTITGLALAGPTFAAAPQDVNYYGPRVTTAVPGTPFNVAFRVKNTGGTSYSNIQVVFHIPNGITTSMVTPANSTIIDNTVSWANVPLEPGKSFYPSFTMTVNSGTPLKEKFSIWVEVTGKDMEGTSTNFSITTKATSATQKTSTLSTTDIKSLFATIYNRQPTASELKYWLARRTDKPGRTALLGAIAFQKNLGLKH